jgi:hypothetical protein
LSCLGKTNKCASKIFNNLNYRWDIACGSMNESSEVFDESLAGKELRKIVIPRAIALASFLNAPQIDDSQELVRICLLRH